LASESPRFIRGSCYSSRRFTDEKKDDKRV
jgi:hypothetical protein